MNALAKDPRRKFIWAEISYFQWWWNDQGQEKRDLARRLLASKQLEFVTGGWVQPDEANSELYAMETQLQEGHDWINQTLGPEFIPSYGWSIDPFGYSPTMAWLLKKYGFKAMLIQRVHYAVKKELAKRKHLECVCSVVVSFVVRDSKALPHIAFLFSLPAGSIGDRHGTRREITISLHTSCLS